MKDDLDSIVANMRRLGVTRYKTADLEIELGPAAGKPMDEEKLRETELAMAEFAAKRRHAVAFAASNMRPRRA